LYICTGCPCLVPMTMTYNSFLFDTLNILCLFFHRVPGIGSQRAGASINRFFLQKEFQYVFHYTLQRYCTENRKNIFPERKLRGLSPNFYIHVHYLRAIYRFPSSVCLYDFSKIGRMIVGIYQSLTDK
jgi:hypothetical protein